MDIFNVLHNTGQNCGSGLLLLESEAARQAEWTEPTRFAREARSRLKLVRCTILSLIFDRI